MKTIIARTALAAALVTGAHLATAETMKVAQIPFDFRVGTQHMPAGAYQITRPVGGVFWFTPKQGKGAGIATAPAGRYGEAGRSQLQFRCAAGECVLSKIAVGGMAYSPALSRRDKERLSSAKPAEVVVAMAR